MSLLSTSLVLPLKHDETGAPSRSDGAAAKRPAAGGGTRSGRTRLGGGAVASPSGETQRTQTLSSGYDPADSPKLPRQETRELVV